MLVMMISDNLLLRIKIWITSSLVVLLHLSTQKDNLLTQIPQLLNKYSKQLSFQHKMRRMNLSLLLRTLTQAKLLSPCPQLIEIMINKAKKMIIITLYHGFILIIQLKKISIMTICLFKVNVSMLSKIYLTILTQQLKILKNKIRCRSRRTNSNSSHKIELLLE